MCLACFSLTFLGGNREFYMKVCGPECQKVIEVTCEKDLFLPLIRGNGLQDRDGVPQPSSDDSASPFL